MRFAVLVLIPFLYLSEQTAPGTDVQAYVPNLTPIHRVEPVASQGVQGTVQALVTIDSRGLVTNVEPLTGPQTLRPPAIDALRQWQFRPVLRDGHPVAAITGQMVHFFTPGVPPSQSAMQFNMAEERSATNRRMELERQFPRSKEQVLADLEQDAGGATGREYSYLLTGLAKAAANAGDWNKAAAYASELLTLAAQYPKDWNHGNAIHDGNMVLGLVALSKDNIAQARQYLLEAGKTSGSPQLDSFGPNMSLASEMIAKGERDTVLEYFAECRAFWKMGGKKLDDWTAMVRGGGSPDFGGNLLY